jgi:hypothetical protein
MENGIPSESTYARDAVASSALERACVGRNNTTAERVLYGFSSPAALIRNLYTSPTRFYLVLEDMP